MIDFMKVSFDISHQITSSHFVNNQNYNGNIVTSKPAITCSKLAIETLEQGVKYVQS